MTARKGRFVDSCDLTHVTGLNMGFNVLKRKLYEEISGELTVSEELLPSSPLAAEDTSLARFCAFLAILGVEDGLDFLSRTPSLAAEIRRLDRRGSSAGIASSRSFAFRLDILLE